jgi:hypothetical protein
LFYPGIAFITIPSLAMNLTIEISGVLTYGQIREEAVTRVKALALRV